MILEGSPALTDRLLQQKSFLEAAGWADATFAPIPGDASTRSYQRLQRGDERAVLMNAPPGAESAACPPEASAAEREALGYNAAARLAGPNLNAFTTLAGVLRAAGVHAPEILAADPGTGFALIEDLGDGLYARMIEAGAEETPLYLAAIDVLARLHQADLPRPAGPDYTLLDYDGTALIAETCLLVDWYWPFLRGGETVPADVRADYVACWQDILAGLSPPHTLVLRDYHAENILWLDNGAADPLSRVGVIDFQDGLFGHAAYDMVSLLEDARRDVGEDTVAAALAHYAAARRATGAFDGAQFAADYAILAAQRNAKILGVFARLVVRDKKPRYESLMPRVRGHFRADLTRPHVAPLKAWITTHMPELTAR